MTNVQGPGGLLDVILHGIGVSPGVVIGPVYKAAPEVTEFSERLLNPGEISDACPDIGVGQDGALLRDCPGSLKAMSCPDCQGRS